MQALPPLQNATNNCPCCDRRLLRQVRGTGIYWFCPHCWQEMPVLDRRRVNSNHYSAHQL
ncbi:hypothetical protein [Chroococcidiopsis sp. CCMEE 29]|uniref:hypothetical protein n=1 Tax=Chroococcidiopsis sp. CCMEE 29 TaxID=155894 RepID=UPI0020228FDC|nr:hypothetical protein [Chroococcidiopsis sp. CCMEE 29]